MVKSPLIYYFSNYYIIIIIEAFTIIKKMNTIKKQNQLHETTYCDNVDFEL